MTVSRADFLKYKPEFSETSTDTIDVYLADSNSACSSEVFGDRLVEAVVARTAYKLAVGPGGRSQRMANGVNAPSVYEVEFKSITRLSSACLNRCM